MSNVLEHAPCSLEQRLRIIKRQTRLRSLCKPGAWTSFLGHGHGPKVILSFAWPGRKNIRVLTRDALASSHIDIHYESFWLFTPITTEVLPAGTKPANFPAGLPGHRSSASTVRDHEHSELAFLGYASNCAQGLPKYLQQTIQSMDGTHSHSCSGTPSFAH